MLAQRTILPILKPRRVLAAGGGLLALGLVLAATPANADVLASSWSINPQLTGAVLIPLDLNSIAVGQQDLSFALPAADQVAISFDAECAVGGANFITQANVTIMVDPAPPGGGFFPVQPTTGADDAFCSANGTVPIDGKLNPSRTVVTRLPAGVNTVRVTLQSVFGAGPSWIDDLSVVVQN